MVKSCGLTTRVVEGETCCFTFNLAFDTGTIDTELNGSLQV
jgi:hypothetical protein